MLHNRRTSTGYGVNPLQYSEVLAFCVLNEVKLYEWEVNLLFRLDQIVLTRYQEDAEKQQKKAQAKSK